MLPFLSSSSSSSFLPNIVQMKRIQHEELVGGGGIFLSSGSSGRSSLSSQLVSMMVNRIFPFPAEGGGILAGLPPLGLFPPLRLHLVLSFTIFI